MARVREGHKGRQRITWSKHLRTILRVAEERTDEEIAEEEIGGETVAVFPDEVWHDVVWTWGLRAQVLTAAESGGLAAVNELLGRHGCGRSIRRGRSGMGDVRKFAVGDMVEVPDQPCRCCRPTGRMRLARVTRFAEDDPAYEAHGLCLGDPPYYMVELPGVARWPNESVVAESWIRAVPEMCTCERCGRETYWWGAARRVVAGRLRRHRSEGVS